MEKFVLTANGKEVKVGDVVNVSVSVDTYFGRITVPYSVVINDYTIPKLVREGLLKPIEGESSSIPMEIAYYVEKIAKRLGWKVDKAFNYLNNVDAIMPAAAFSMILREIAVELDKKYEDHIENSPEIYVISSFDGRITKANKAHIKNYRNFAAFRSIEDARVAYRIVKPVLKEMFKGDSK